MKPTFSVIFLTTLIGVGQGLFLALYSSQLYAAVNLLPAQEERFYLHGSLLALLFLIAGLVAAIFHLGKPSYFITRAWRGMSQWRTSWLSRELIFMPMVIGLVALYALFHWLAIEIDLFGNGMKGQITLIIGALTTLATFALFISTGMIYASVKFLQEWACSLTVINYTLFGAASGFTLAAAYATYNAPAVVSFYAGWAIILTAVVMVTRVIHLLRNQRIKYKSTIQTAIGMRHSQIKQKAMGMMGGSYNTREYFHGASRLWLRSIKWIFLLLTFPLPLLLLAIGMGSADQSLLLAAFIVQYVGLMFERWFFFAQANHPQNLYYQTV
jgi:sulfite dehydrogenase (quinone) subunit SoeC